MIRDTPRRAVTSRRIITIAVVLALVLGGLLLARSTRASTIRLSADFTQAIALYPGDDVRVVGVPIGKITRVTPSGDGVTVEMSIDADTPVAADTGAVIVPPGVLSSRYVQLTKPWTGGPRLADGASLSQARTASPLELDDVSRQLDRFLKAVGPDGLNKSGALSRVVDASSRALAGNGTQLRSTLHDLAAALSTLGSNSGNIVTTIEHLGTFAKTLDESDGAIRQVETHLADVSTQLAGQRTQIRSAIHAVREATTAIHTFLKQNKDNLSADVRSLAVLSTTLRDHERDLTEILDLLPLGAQNLLGAGNTSTDTVDTRIDFSAGFPATTATTLCNLLQQAALSRLCAAIGAPSPETP